jgi:hypothetical protein
MDDFLIEWIKQNPASFEDSDDSYHNRQQMKDFAKAYLESEITKYGLK